MNKTANLLAATALGLVLALAAGTAPAAPAAAAPDPAATNDPLNRAALSGPRAQQAVMLAVATAGSRVVAAGERGVILWSDDAGRSWQQAQVPVATTLAALSFPDTKNGWAVGHGGVVLHSADGGTRWTRQLEGRAAARLESAAASASGDAKRIERAEHLVVDGPDKPLLAVHFSDARNGVAVGAYGIAFATEDGGKTWVSWMDRIPNPRGLHLNAIHRSGQDIYLAGEQGLLVHSADGGRSFQALPTPYHGSWFALAGRDGVLVLAGLRGNVWRSDDKGRHWMQASSALPVTVVSASAAAGGAWLFVNQAGTVLASTDGGRSLQVLTQPRRAPVTALAELPDGTLVAATFAGASALPSRAPGSTGPRP